MKCTECVDKSCESPYNEDGECWSPNTLLQAVADGSVKLVQALLKGEPPWWIKYPWADSIHEVWDEQDDRS